MDAKENPGLPMLRHSVATLAYRAAKCLRDAPAGFAEFRAGPTTRPAVAIVAHMGDLMEWAVTAVDGNLQWHDAAPGAWDDEVARFYAALKRLDERLSAGPQAQFSPEKVFQGPIADALTHVGQLATLRRLARSGIRGESYFRADIAVGQVGPDQPPAVREFD